MARKRSAEKNPITEETAVAETVETPAEAVEIPVQTIIEDPVPETPAEPAPVKIPAKRGRKPGKAADKAAAKATAAKAVKKPRAKKAAAEKVTAEKKPRGRKAVAEVAATEVAATEVTAAEKKPRAKKAVAEKKPTAKKTAKTAVAKKTPKATAAKKPAKAEAVTEAPAPKTRGRKKSISYNDIVMLAQTALGGLKPSAKIMKIPVNIIIHGAAEGTFYILIENGSVDVEPYKYEDSAADIRISADNFQKLLEKKFPIAEGIASMTFEVTGDYKKALIACLTLFA